MVTNFQSQYQRLTSKPTFRNIEKINYTTLPHFPFVNERLGPRDGLPRVLWGKFATLMLWESNPFMYWLFCRPMSSSTNALLALWAFNSSKIMQLHSGSGFFNELLVLELELVELVPELLVEFTGGLGCSGHEIWRFLVYCVGIPERWFAAARA